jgi:hypothetical protein
MKNGGAKPGAILLGAYAGADDLWGYSTLLAAGV